MADFPAGTANEQPSPGRGLNPRAVRALGVVVLAAVVVVFVVQNSQPVAVRLWFVTGHVRLIWVIVVCLAVAGAFGFVVGRRGRRRRRRHRGTDSD